MNLLVNRLDNIQISHKSFPLFPADKMSELNLAGSIVGPNSEYLVNGKNVMVLVHNPKLETKMGEQMYRAMIRKPMMLFLIPTQENEFDVSVDELDKLCGIQTVNLNNFAQAFSIACWFIKDSCIRATHTYWLNFFRGYYSQSSRSMDVTLSDGTIAEINFDDQEVQSAIMMMYTVLRYLLPDEAHTGDVRMTISGGTKVWEVDKAMSTEGKSFARALLLLQEARRTGMLSTKIDKYCSLLECLFAIDGNHKKNISSITAAYIAKDEAEKEIIKFNMRTAYGVRSDSSHGGSLQFLRKHKQDDLAELSKTVDDYVRRVLSKVLAQDELNYDNTHSSKEKVKKHFLAILKTEQQN